MSTLFSSGIRRSLVVPALATLLLAGSALINVPDAFANAAADADIVSAFVVLGDDGVPVARVVTSTSTCPSIKIDGVNSAMTARALPQTLPLRDGQAKPAAFPMLICEKFIPPHAENIAVNGRRLPLPPAQVNRIVVIGDTGCRIKKADNASQACNDTRQYPFAVIAAMAAKWKPDLVVHVGDYLYRENPCPADVAGCSGSPWGYGWDAWDADFFEPAKALLQAAPWVAARGNHESCARAGQGWWRLLDPRPLIPGRDCVTEGNDDNGDYSDPYAVPLGGDEQIIVLDSSNTLAKPIKSGDIREIKYADMYRKFDALSQQASYNIGVEHHPILGAAAKEDKHGEPTVLPGNAGLQSVFAAQNPLLFPSRVDLMLSGHVHVWEQLSFSTDYPSQLVAGFSGTSEDLVPLPAALPAGFAPAPGAIVDHFSSWVAGFGFMTMERAGAGRWDVKVWDVAGRQVNSCRIEGRKSSCEVMQVKDR